MKWLFFKPIKIFRSIVTKKKQKNPKKTKQNKSKKRIVGLTEKYLKIEEYLNIYDRKLCERNQCLECSGILLKMGFIACEMKVYPWKLSFWTCTKLRILFDLGNPTRHLIYYAKLNLSTKTTGLAYPQAVNEDKASAMAT